MKKNKQKYVAEPAADYGQGLTFEKVWLMFQDTREFLKENARQIEKSSKETERKMRETDRKIAEISKIVGGIGKNNGDFAEEFFKSAFSNSKIINGVKFNIVSTNLKNVINGLEGEYDIVLTNCNTVMVVEVKYKLHESDIDDFVNVRLPRFKQIFPQYMKHNLWGAVAALVIPKDFVEKSEKLGLFVFTQNNNKIKRLNSKKFKPETF